MRRTTSASEAAAAIRAGLLVAFPTETVYGLGANALDAAAVARIFKAKGRPPTSPLIVHVDSVAMARGLAAEWPRLADRLTAAFWPGPLTLVVRKAPSIPDSVTAGLPTVGLRMPAHPLALELIGAAGVPIAAPSANRFTELSPTRAAHVDDELADVLLEGGPSEVGIESTVLSLVGQIPLLLRPGAISAADLKPYTMTIAAAVPVDGAHPAPGMHARHYCPRTPLWIGPPAAQGRGAYLWLTAAADAPRPIPMPSGARAYAAILYDTLHALDAEGLDWIAVEAPPDTPEWDGIRDRLARASCK